MAVVISEGLAAAAGGGAGPTQSETHAGPTPQTGTDSLNQHNRRPRFALQNSLPSPIQHLTTYIYNHISIREIDK